MKREFKEFHVVVVQWRQRNKDTWCTCKVVVSFSYLKPRSRVAVFVWKRIFFFFLRLSLPSTLTNALKLITGNAPFQKRSPESRFLKTYSAFLLRVDGRKRFRIRNTMMSDIIYFQHNACALMKLWYFYRFSVFVWTSHYDSDMLRVVAYLFENGGKNLRNKKYPDITAWPIFVHLCLFSCFLSV